MPTRSPEQIRGSIEATRRDLSTGVGELQGKLRQLADWRGHLARNRQQALIGAAVAGFLIGGGIGATLGLFRSDDD